MKKYREKKCKCPSLHGLFHRHKHFEMIEHATKIIFYDMAYFIPRQKCVCKASWIRWQGEYVNKSLWQLYRHFHNIQAINHEINYVSWKFVAFYNISAMKQTVHAVMNRLLALRESGVKGFVVADEFNVLCWGEARAIWDVGHYGKSLYLQNSESSNCICVFHYSSVICRLRRASNIYIL